MNAVLVHFSCPREIMVFMGVQYAHALRTQCIVSALSLGFGPEACAMRAWCGYFFHV